MGAITCVLSGGLIYCYEKLIYQPGMELIVRLIIEISGRIPIASFSDYIFIFMNYFLKAFIALIGVAIINGITGNGFKVRLTSPGEN